MFPRLVYCIFHIKLYRKNGTLNIQAGQKENTVGHELAAKYLRREAVEYEIERVIAVEEYVKKVGQIVVLLGVAHQKIVHIVGQRAEEKVSVDYE